MSLSKAALEELAKRAPQPDPTRSRSSVGNDGPAMLEAVLADLAAAGIEAGLDKPKRGGGRVWELSACPYSNDHEDSAHLIQFDDGGVHVGCLHERCQGKTTKDAPGVFTRTLATRVLNGGPTRPGGGYRPRRAATEIGAGHVILDKVHAFLGRFVAYPSAHAHAAHALWIAHTHLMDQWDSTPRIAFLSPEPGSGKTRALEASEPLVPSPVVAMNMSAAYLFRKVSDQAGRPTVLFDEIDTIFGPKAGPHEEVRGLLNAGHRRGAKAGRVEMQGKKAVPVEYPAYCAVALAGLGDLPDTILTRSVIVRMRKRAPGERVDPWRARIEEPKAHELRADLADWAFHNAGRISWPDDMPPSVEDRDADVWEPLLAVADAAGGNWPTLARAAAVTMVADTKAVPLTLGVRLLEDLRTVFGNADKMTTDDILKALHHLDEAPWAEIIAGKPLNPRGLATRLTKYGVKSQTIRFGTGEKDTAKGYRREDLADSWNRYLSPPPLKERHKRHKPAHPCLRMREM